jgi:type III secretory pathway component EscS
MYWAILVISTMTTSVIAYVGHFEKESDCAKAVTELKAQNLPYTTKIACVQMEAKK